jgi:AraC-like DNA-binding protein
MNYQTLPLSIMVKVAQQLNVESLPTVVSRLAGTVPQWEDAFDIGSTLRVERYNIQGTDLLPEERGALLCLPVADEMLGIQLAYVLTDNEDASIICLHIHPDFLTQWPVAMISQEPALRFDHMTEHELRLDVVSTNLLNQLIEPRDAGLTDALHQMELAIQLLRRAIEQLSHPFAACPVPACRFLAYESEREKIIKARDILDAHYDEKMTIKTLARKVAMNECYLKKGFKTLTGSTIHDYIASRRISSAKHMLQVEGRSVTEVAAKLGYSSISHFSTAFKKATGLKPCELLA